MIAIGLGGGPDVPGQTSVAPGLSPLFFHDAAAAIAIDGSLVFAVEEERLTRLKHTNSFPVNGVRACLDFANIRADRVDWFAFFFEEDFYDLSLLEDCRGLGLPEPPPVRSLLARRLSEALDFACPLERLCFVNHHRAHARSALSASGHDECLVAVIDGNGERDSLSLFSATAGQLTLLTSVPASQSLGRFYRSATRLAGFGLFDEYKFMGLAPYGRPGPVVAQVEALIKQGDDGAFEVDVDGLAGVSEHSGVRPSAGGRPDQAAADFALAVQGVLERTVIRFLQPWIKESGLRRLCLAGGVAQNCVMNSRIAELQELDRVFVYPAAHDGGAPAGAALEAGIVEGEGCRLSGRGRGKHFNALLGPPVCDGPDIERVLQAWSPLLAFEMVADPAIAAGALIAEGAVIGRVVGRSEYGPRALGARSILADPRPVSNWQRINLAIKNRESFRPFAPACLEEFAADYFICPPGAENLRHMTFIAKVREEKTAYLGAVTHVDGTARLQTVSREADADLHSLISAFWRISGCPVVLNTSFNTSYEPVVHSAHDAVQTFLRTELDALVIGNWVVKKQSSVRICLDQMETRVSAYTHVHVPDGAPGAGLLFSRAPAYEVRSSGRLQALLDAGARDRWVALGPVLDEGRYRSDLESAVINLWRAGLLDLRYACRG